jgi:hypothetical protein
VAAQLRKPPVNVPRLLLHPHGMAPRIANLDQWAWHVIDALRQETMRNPNDRLQALVTELQGLVPERPRDLGPDHLGFAVPLRLSSDTANSSSATLTHSGTAVDVTVAELRLEALLPADRATASILTKLGQAPPQRG